MKFEVVSCNKIAKEKWDELIFSDSGNGEFINSREYLSYHPQDRFIDNSVAVIDSESRTLRSIFPAASLPGEEKILISHPGTTFAGVIFDTRRLSLNELALHLELLCVHYKKKGFRKIDIQIPPTIYYNQPREDLFFLFWQSGFKIATRHLANVIYLKNINNEEDLLINYHHKKRQHIRKMSKEDSFVFRQRDTIGDGIWKIISNNLRDRYKSKPTHSFEEISFLHSKFPKQIVPYVVSEKDNNQYAAVAIVYKFKRVFHLQYLHLNYGLSTDKYPNEQLIHKLLLEALKENFNYFSFGTSPIENWIDFLGKREVKMKGVPHYKNQFGGGSAILYKLEKSL